VLNFGFVSNVGGNDWVFYQLSETREAEKSVTPIIYHGERCGLDSSFVVFPANATGQIAIVRRENYGGRTLTWIGLYRSAPSAYNALRAQSGSFFYGVGVWLSGSRISGADIATLLRQAIGLMGESFDKEKRPEEWNIRKYADDWMKQCAARAQAISDAEKTLGAGEGVSAAPNLARCCIDISGESETHGLAYALDLAQTAPVFNAKYGFAYISDDRAVIRAFEHLRRCDMYERTRLILEAPAPPASAGASSFSAAVRRSEPFSAPVRDFAPTTRISEAVASRYEAPKDTAPDYNRAVLQTIEKLRASIRLGQIALLVALFLAALLLVCALLAGHAAVSEVKSELQKMNATIAQHSAILRAAAAKTNEIPPAKPKQPDQGAQPADARRDGPVPRELRADTAQELNADLRQVETALDDFEAVITQTRGKVGRKSKEGLKTLRQMVRQYGGSNALKSKATAPVRDAKDREAVLQRVETALTEFEAVIREKQDGSIGPNLREAFTALTEEIQELRDIYTRRYGPDFWTGGAGGRSTTQAP
jgi:hypothetical protein